MKKYLLIICSFLCILCMLTGCAGKNSAAKVRAAEGSMQEVSFSKEEYQKLLEFQFDGYEDMSISAYQEKAWQLMDKPECFYMPLSAPEPDNTARDVNAPEEQERRDYPNGTKEDYKSLLALKTPDYQEMSLADFNRKLLDWANENYERMERINGDVGYHDFKLPLTEEERRFVICSTNFSGMENAKYVQSNYTGREETEPSLDRYLPEKTTIENDRSAWCDLYYRFSWKIMDKETLTVGERDRRIAGLLEDIQRFWDKTELDILLGMDKSEIVKELQKIAESYSTEQLGITIMEDYVSFECMDERGIG